ncbi:hypothetical protein SEUCBS139899_000126 [Sporothrix eucalyptigena]
MAEKSITNERPAGVVVDTITCDEAEERELEISALALVELLPCKTRVRKRVLPCVPIDDRRTIMIEAMRTEIAIYNHLPKGHPRFLEMLASYDTGVDVGIELPFLPIRSLRTYLERHHVDIGADGSPVIPSRLRARWVIELTDGIDFLHKNGVIHCDIKPHNVLLDDTLGVRIIDLAGSRLGDLPSLCCETVRFYMPRPRDNPQGTVSTDLFALGISFFEIVTGAQPFGDVGDPREIVLRYKRGEFASLVAVTASPSDVLPPKFITKYKSTNPDEVAGRRAPANTSVAARALAPADASGREVLFASVMRRCWHGQFASAADVLVALAEETRTTLSVGDVAYIEGASGLSLQAATVSQRLPRTPRPDVVNEGQAG